MVAANINIKALATLSDIGILTKNIDVRDSKKVTELITHTHSKRGHINLLCNKTSNAFGFKLENTIEGKFENHIAFHLPGRIYGIRASIPIMRS